MALHHINGRTIRTTREFPPIPVRSFDWSAIDDDTYDVDCDQDGFFSKSRVGRGATEQEAINDLLEQMEDEAVNNAVADAMKERTGGATLQELMAASAMATALQKIISSGVLPVEQEQDLRVLVLRSCRAFGMTPIAEKSA